MMWFPPTHVYDLRGVGGAHPYRHVQRAFSPHVLAPHGRESLMGLGSYVPSSGIVLGPSPAPRVNAPLTLFPPTAPPTATPLPLAAPTLLSEVESYLPWIVVAVAGLALLKGGHR